LPVNATDATKESQAMQKTGWITLLLASLIWLGQAGADDTQLTGFNEDTMPELAQSAESGSEWHFVAGGVAAVVPRYEGASSRHGVVFRCSMPAMANSLPVTCGVSATSS
jgi:hypothetical protein